MSRALSSTTPSGRGECKSGKVQYANRKQARAAAKHLPSQRLGVYRCPACDWFHLGHLPQRVRAGDVDKEAWLDSKHKNNKSPKARARRRAERAAQTFTPSDLARIVANRKDEPA